MVDSKQGKWLWRSCLPNGTIKSVISLNSPENICAGVHFLIKLEPVDLRDAVELH